jgi:putative endonuclease
VEQLVARRAHNPKVTGSSPVPATIKASHNWEAFFMPFYVYVIKSEEGHRYTGQTPDLDRRLYEHNSGLSHSTKHGHNWKYIYTEEFETRGDAMEREKYLKSSAGRRYVKKNQSYEDVRAGWSPSRGTGRSSSSGS